MFERFTERARQVVVLAQEEARALKHNYIGTEHLLLGLLREEEGVAARVLDSLEVSVEEVRAAVVRIVGSGEEAPQGQIPFTPRAKKVLELALREALSLGHNYIGTEHILLGLVREDEGVAARILLDLDAEPEKIRNEVMRTLSGPGRRGQQQAAGESKRSLQGAGTVRPQPHPHGGGRQARPVHRPHHRDRARHADPLAPHQEQPGAHRRAGRGQDGHRRGPRPAHRGPRGARAAQGQAGLHAGPRRAGRRLQVPRRVRGAAQEGDEGDPRAGRHHPVHRRAPQPGGRRRRRGRHRRGQHPQAGAGPRRAADHRRHHHGRVPQVPGAGRRPGAPLPADQGGRAVGRGDHRDPQGAARPLRGPSSHPHHRRGADAQRRSWRTATSATASCRTRRSTSSTRPPAACASAP